MEERVDVASKKKGHRPRKGVFAEPLELRDVTAHDHTSRLTTGIGELDRVLGGGFVPGSLVLLAGEPGIGKSTLLLEVLFRLSSKGRNVLYVSGEESPGQVKMRAERIKGVVPDGLWILSETDTDLVEEVIKRMEPDFVAVDSIQTMVSPEVQSAPGTVTQVREAAQRFMQMAKGSATPVTLVGHVTKEGAIAGPRVLEHLVDTVLFFEGDRTENFRLLRTIKNRFGPTFEVGVFEMAASGLREVLNPSEFFLAMRPESVPGSVIAPVMQGTRPILVEIQALVSPSYLAIPRRTSIGVDSNRLALILAILEKHLHFPFFDKDVFVNVVGGIKIQETALDLALVLALVSSLKDQPLPNELVAFGEVGLSGEVRPVGFWDLRLEEAKRLGFTMAVVPRVEALAQYPRKGFDVLAGVGRISDALEAVIGSRH